MSIPTSNCLLTSSYETKASPFSSKENLRETISYGISLPQVTTWIHLVFRSFDVILVNLLQKYNHHIDEKE